ncbi:MAG: DNA repair photolyase [Planctomycetota bacterium]|jgi:DNA repair photolyase
MNPGKVTMSPAYNQTWESLHKLAVNVARNRARLEQAKKIQERKIRAEAVAEILPLLPYEGRQLCFSVIADCGKDGFDSALLIMNSKEKSTRRNVYEFLLKCDPSRAIPLLVQVIEKETTYFEEHRSRLQQGWWNGNRDTLKQVHIDRDHYSDVHRALYVLRQSKDDRLIKPVTTLKDLWVSHEPYNDPSGLNQMSKACQKILARHELR